MLNEPYRLLLLPGDGVGSVIVRELTSGIYSGDKGIDHRGPGGTRGGYDLQVYSDHEIERVGRVAFELARSRRSKVTSVEKSNVMESILACCRQ